MSTNMDRQRLDPNHNSASATTNSSNIEADLQIIHKWTNLTHKTDYGTLKLESSSTHGHNAATLNQRLGNRHQSNQNRVSSIDQYLNKLQWRLHIDTDQGAIHHHQTISTNKWFALTKSNTHNTNHRKQRSNYHQHAEAKIAQTKQQHSIIWPISCITIGEGYQYWLAQSRFYGKHSAFYLLAYFKETIQA